MPARRERRYRTIGEGNGSTNSRLEVELADVSPAYDPDADVERGKDEKDEGNEETESDDDLVVDVTNRKWLKRKGDLREMLRKRWIIARRDRRGFLFQIVLPVLVNIAVMCVLFLEVNPAGPSREMTACMFTQSTGGHAVPELTRVPVAAGINSSVAADISGGDFIRAGLDRRASAHRAPPSAGRRPEART